MGRHGAARRVVLLPLTALLLIEAQAAAGGNPERRSRNGPAAAVPPGMEGVAQIREITLREQRWDEQRRFRPSCGRRPKCGLSSGRQTSVVPRLIDAPVCGP